MRTLTGEETAELARRAASPTGRVGMYTLARIYGVTPQWVRELRRRFLEGRSLPGLARPGRPPHARPGGGEGVHPSVRGRGTREPRRLGARDRGYHGIHIPHNRIWRVLKEAGIVRNESRKQRRRPWVRFERRFSNALWQMDYTILGPGRWLLVILDDASRLIVGYAVTRRPTAELAWATVRGAGERYGFPGQLLTDHGTQFTKEPYEAEGLFDRRLRELERERGIRVEHVHGRVKHPQTGGKVERVNGTIKASLRRRRPDGRARVHGRRRRPALVQHAEAPHEPGLRAHGDAPRGVREEAEAEGAGGVEAAEMRSRGTWESKGKRRKQVIAGYHIWCPIRNA